METKETTLKNENMKVYVNLVEIFNSLKDSDKTEFTKLIIEEINKLQEKEKRLEV